MKSTAELISWLTKLSLDAHDISFSIDVEGYIPDYSYSINLGQAAERLAELEAALKHCLERADRAIHRTPVHHCDATNECISIMQRCQRILQPK